MFVAVDKLKDGRVR